jgi:hypothetical protein
MKTIFNALKNAVSSGECGFKQIVQPKSQGEQKDRKPDR